MTVYSTRHQAANADQFLTDRERDFFRLDNGKIVGVAAIVALEHHQADIALVVPDELAGRVLHVKIDVVRMLIGPIHGDDELGLLFDLAGLCFGLHG